MPFRAWGLALTVVLVVMIVQRNWSATGWVAAALLIYLVGLRPTLCRVETVKRRPCRWRVRGYLRCCDYHRGRKNVMPTLYLGPRSLVPVVMWPRHDLDFAPAEPQPSSSAHGAEAVAPRDRAWSAQEKATILVAVASLLVAVMSFIRDLVAG